MNRDLIKHARSLSYALMPVGVILFLLAMKSKEVCDLVDQGSKHILAVILFIFLVLPALTILFIFPEKKPRRFCMEDDLPRIGYVVGFFAAVAIMLVTC